MTSLTELQRLDEALAAARAEIVAARSLANIANECRHSAERECNQLRAALREALEHWGSSDSDLIDRLRALRGATVTPDETTTVRDMTEIQRKAHREFWIAWVEHAQQQLGALLAETIDETPSTSDTVYECVNMLIDVEQQLSACLDPAPVQRAWSKA
jgi:hypothetical protein